MNMKSRSLSYWPGVLCMVFMLSACYYNTPDHSDAWDMTQVKQDSLRFKATHHYTENYNFMLVADSLVLSPQAPLMHLVQPSDTDSLRLNFDDRLVVADILIVPTDTVDSVWIKVARDQYTMGWIQESRLLECVVPDDSISYFIHVFSNSHLIWFISFMGCVLLIYLFFRMRRRPFRMVHFNDIGSCYPTLLCLTLSGAATLYASIQNFVPETWQEFYYNPTLNPFSLPFILGLFITSVWLIVMLTLATIEDVYRQLPFSQAVLYLIALLAACMVCYLFFSITTLYYIGYPCLVAYTIWALWRYYKKGRCNYACGKCGAKMREAGKCPKCGTLNEF